MVHFFGYNHGQTVPKQGIVPPLVPHVMVRKCSGGGGGKKLQIRNRGDIPPLTGKTLKGPSKK